MSIQKTALAALFLQAAFPFPVFAQGVSSGDLDTLIITATRQPMRAGEILSDATVIDRAEIERNGQGTIVDLLSRQPGIQTTSSGGPGTATSFYVRGANSEQTKILVDGVPINSIDNSGSPLRFLPLSGVERIEILRGPAATLYGADAIGGVIQIITKRGQPGLRADGFIGYGSHNTRRVAAGISGGNEYWRFRLEANHYATDGISAQRHASNKDADDDAYRNTGGAASLSFLPTRDHEFGFSYRANSGVAHFDSGNTPPYGIPNGAYDTRERFEARQWQVFARNHFFDGLWKSTLQYGEAVDDQMNHFEFYDSPLWTRVRLLSWQNDIRLPLGTLLLAAERQRQNVRADDTGAFDRAHSVHDNACLVGWSAHYGNHSWQLNARSDRHSRYGHENTHGLAYGYQITPEFRARLGYGTAFKAPSLDQLYNAGYGNVDLGSEKSRNREAALIWERGAHTASVTWYLNRLRNMIGWDSSLPGPWGGRYANINRARLSGATLAYAGQLGVWRIGASYDYLDARTRDEDGYWVPLGRRARHSATFTVDRTWGGKFTTGAEVVAQGRRHDGTYAKAVAAKEELGGYAIINLAARYALTRDLAIEGRLNNLFDRKYETARYYNTEGFNAFIGLRYSPQ
ncbi:MAG: TonB-dependent receptor [Zoogloeaceae bacterium]|jgi:vitamin B12 transporter|nr:TonB-dependent receptor [Zoogloeaceae bacterium]